MTWLVSRLYYYLKIINILTVDENHCENGCDLQFTVWVEILFTIFTIFLTFVLIRIFDILKQRERRIILNKKCISNHALNLYKPYQHCFQIRFVHINISSNEILYPDMNYYFVSVNHYVVSTSKIVTVDNPIVLLINQPQLICYTDGSYSHGMQIGHSGFRASDGSCRIHRYSPQYPKKGSTESEVFAAYLAIKYATKNHYNTLVIRTDNSKVEQLLCRPKNKDNNSYPIFCQIINKYRQENGNDSIQVERVRGHPTYDEQNQCEIKREFAKIDRLVRKKTRQYIRRQRITYARFYQYWYPYTYYRYTVPHYLYYF